MREPYRDDKKGKGSVDSKSLDGDSHNSGYGSGDFQGGFGYDKGGKRYRRTANEIERRFQCWCGKAYGSEGSLNQHKKLKNHYTQPGYHR